MSAGLTDRQRVEIAIPARMAFEIAACDCFAPNPAVAPDEAQAEMERNVARLKELLVTACLEPITDLPEATGIKVARRVERVADKITAPYANQPAIKFAMVLFYFLQDLLDRDVLVLWEGSAFGAAMQLLVPMFEHGFSIEKQDASAQRQARRLLEQLQREGYYQ